MHIGKLCEYVQMLTTVHITHTAIFFVQKHDVQNSQTGTARKQTGRLKAL